MNGPFLCIPRRTLSVSVTGEECALRCNHCGAHYLHHMVPVAAAQRVLEESDEYGSILLSGGCDATGRVPLLEHLAFIQWVHARGIRINAHVGLQEDREIPQLAPYFDRVSLDYVWDEETIHSVYHTQRHGTDYLHAVQAWIQAFQRQNDTAQAAKRRVGLHLTIGLLGGKLAGELPAIASLVPLQPSTLIFLVLIPTEGTVYEGVPPVPLKEVETVFAYARQMLPGTGLILGCMHPKVHGYGEELAALAEKYRFLGVVGEPGTGMQREKIEECCAFYQ